MKNLTHKESFVLDNGFMRDIDTLLSLATSTWEKINDELHYLISTREPKNKSETIESIDALNLHLKVHSDLMKAMHETFDYASIQLEKGV